MSGKHWLEREPQNSPGLQRIREAQQAAVLVKAQKEQWKQETEIATREAEQKRLEMIARIEQKTAQVLPLLEEIKDFANQTGIYPLAELHPLKTTFPPIELNKGIAKLISKASISRTNSEVLPAPLMLDDTIVGRKPADKYMEGRVNLEYAFLGKSKAEVWSGGYGDRQTLDWVGSGTGIKCGISLKINGVTGEIKLLRQRVEKIPAYSAKGLVPAHEIISDDWITLSDEENQRKVLLAEAFYNPVYLGV